MTSTDNPLYMLWGDGWTSLDVMTLVGPDVEKALSPDATTTLLGASRRLPGVNNYNAEGMKTGVWVWMNRCAISAKLGRSVCDHGEETACRSHVTISCYWDGVNDGIFLGIVRNVVTLEESYKSGLAHGTVIQRNVDDGTMACHFNYYSGVQVGLQTEYFWCTGVPAYTYHMGQHGLRHGPETVYNRDGTVKETREFRRGQAVAPMGE